MGRLMMRDSKVEEALPLEGIVDPSPSDNLAVTFSKDGRPLSIFSDDIWDYSATTTNVRVLNFRQKIQRIDSVDVCDKANTESLDEAIKFLKIFTLQWITAVGGCSMSKLNGDLVSISFLVRHCLDSGAPAENLLSEPSAIDFLVRRASTDKQAGLFLGKIQRIADTANTLSGNIFWTTIKPSPSFLVRLIQIRKKFPETSDTTQTLLIPSAIYQDTLKQTIEDLDCFLENKSSIQILFSARANIRDQAVEADSQTTSRSISRAQQVRLSRLWKKEIEENKSVAAALKALAKEGIAKDESWGGLVETLRKWQIRCAILIAAFTGMRRNEIQAIPVNGLKFLTTDNSKIPVVWSTTSKLEKNGAPLFTKWVTSSIVENAFKVGKIICEGVLQWSTDRDLRKQDPSEVPLFVSIEHATKSTPHPCFNFAATTLGLKDLCADAFEKVLTVSEHDYAEISWFLYGENIPPEIKIGFPWPLQLHQFRRSMTVYAAASGRVTYPVLKSQLKHISMVMTVYYSENNSRAKNIFGDNTEAKAVNADWQDAKARIEADDLHLLLESGQPLAGSAGKKLQSQRARSELPTFYENRKTTKQAVKKGKVRYRPTMVGGCMSLQPCNRGAGVLASACVSCENAVFLPGSQVALEQTKQFYIDALAAGAPKLARQEYESNIKKIDSFLKNLTETLDKL